MGYIGPEYQDVNYQNEEEETTSTTGATTTESCRDIYIPTGFKTLLGFSYFLLSIAFFYAILRCRIFVSPGITRLRWALFYYLTIFSITIGLSFGLFYGAEDVKCENYLTGWLMQKFSYVCVSGLLGLTIIIYCEAGKKHGHTPIRLIKVWYYLTCCTDNVAYYEHTLHQDYRPPKDKSEFHYSGHANRIWVENENQENYSNYGSADSNSYGSVNSNYM